MKKNETRHFDSLDDLVKSFDDDDWGDDLVNLTEVSFKVGPGSIFRKIG